MVKNKKGKKRMRNDATSTTEQNIDSMSAPEMTTTNQPSTPESNISEPLLSGALNTISKQVKDIADSLPKKIASREDLWQLLEATRGKLDSVADNINFRLSGIETVTRNVDRKIDGVIKKKDLDFAENHLSNKILQAEDSVLRNIRSDMERGLQTLRTELQSKISSEAVSATNSVNKSVRISKDTLTQQLSNVEGRIKEIGESTEMIRSLPGKIDDIAEILSARGLQIKQELPALNHDEETLAQLAQYGEKILQQLSIAARWYARKMPELSKHETEIKNLTETHAEELTSAAKDGEARGR